MTEPIQYPSETARYRHLTEDYCVGAGLDIASAGDPVVPWAWQLELPKAEFAHYNSGHAPLGPIQLEGHAQQLPVVSGSLDFVYSSHLLEDFPDWEPVLREWVRPLKKGGHLVVLIPDRQRWCEACAKGQTPNDFHRHEGRVGELSEYCARLGLEVIKDEFTNLYSGDYTILFVAKKV